MIVRINQQNFTYVEKTAKTKKKSFETGPENCTIATKKKQMKKDTRRIFDELKKIDETYCSHGTVEYFRSAHMEPTNRLNFNPSEWFYHLPMRRAPTLPDLTTTITTNISVGHRTPVHSLSRAEKAYVIATCRMMC